MQWRGSRSAAVAASELRSIWRPSTQRVRADQYNQKAYNELFESVRRQPRTNEIEYWRKKSEHMSWCSSSALHLRSR